jgi:hypothetical protein
VTGDAVRRYCNSQVAAEWGRLDRHPVEFSLTKRIVARWIAEPRAKILDVGAEAFRGMSAHYLFAGRKPR